MADATAYELAKYVQAGITVAVVGDGAVGLLGILSAQQIGAERIFAMSRLKKRQTLARDFGATDIVTERGNEGVGRIIDLVKGIRELVRTDCWSAWARRLR